MAAEGRWVPNRAAVGRFVWSLASGILFLLGQFITDDGGKTLGRSNAQLLVDVEPAKNHIDVFRRHPKFSRQESNHVIGRPACHRGGGDADFKLAALGLANGVFLGARCPQNIEHQSLSIPGAERVGLRCGTGHFDVECGGWC